MSLSFSWAPGAGACHVESVSSAWKGFSLSDWQTGGTTCSVDSWRSSGPSAELDAASGAKALAPGLAPEVVRTTQKVSKTKKKSQWKGKSNHGLALKAEAQHKKEAAVAVAESKAFSGKLVEQEISKGKVVEVSDGLHSVKPEGQVAAFGTPLEAGVKNIQLPSAEAGGDNELEALQFDFVVVGSGIAGLRFALDVAEYGTVAVVTKSERQEGSTHYAQGGVSAVLDPKDSVENHIRDTIVAGAYLNDEEVVEVVCREGPARVRELMEMGASFDKGEDGRLQLAREGGHSHHRIVHAADVTGREIQRALLVAAQKSRNISLFEHHFVVDLLTRPNKDGVPSVCYGVDALDVHSGQVQRFLAGSTLLATGGAGHVYPNTTNPPVATGDGIALAQRCQAVISNMEFVQFHPTSLADSGLPFPPSEPRANAFLITEAVRGAGGILYNQSGERFMLQYDSRAELAPRDVVARSIDDQLKKRGEQFVWLDISHKPKEGILAHFPNIAAECRRGGIDITSEPIPVVPAAHYICGGVHTGLHGETSLEGLWAAGEVACTGLHGANRLASNSLLEALVFAQRAVEPAMEHALKIRECRIQGGDHGQSLAVEDETTSPTPPLPLEGGVEGSVEVAPSGSLPVWHAMPRASGLAPDDERAGKAGEVTAVYRRKLQSTMWQYVGIVRSTEHLAIALEDLTLLAEDWKRDLECTARLPAGAVTVEICEMRNLLAVAMLIVQSALSRQESRGLHFTTDFPESIESQRLPTVLNQESFALLWPEEGAAAALEGGILPVFVESKVP